MALATQLYLVTRDIAIRSGIIESRYRIADGRFVLDNKDLSYIRFTPDEYIDGLKGVEKVSKDDAMLLIKENGYKMSGHMFNIYHVSPNETRNPNEYVTELCFPIG